MKRTATILSVCLTLASPAAAEDDLGEGMNLLEEGAKIILRNLMEDLDDLADDMTPMMLELRSTIGDLSQYHMPEVLPNGDIIIRRKSPLVPETPGADGEEVEI